MPSKCIFSTNFKAVTLLYEIVISIHDFINVHLFSCSATRAQACHLEATFHLQCCKSRKIFLYAVSTHDNGEPFPSEVYPQMIKGYKGTVNFESFNKLRSQICPPVEWHSSEEKLSLKHSCTVHFFQVFVELIKEQEEEDSNVATLNGTISWERSQEDRVIF